MSLVTPTWDRGLPARSTLAAPRNASRWQPSAPAPGRPRSSRAPRPRLLTHQLNRKPHPHLPQNASFGGVRPERAGGGQRQTIKCCPLRTAGFQPALSLIVLTTRADGSPAHQRRADAGVRQNEAIYSRNSTVPLSSLSFRVPSSSLKRNRVWLYPRRGAPPLDHKHSW
jgi:hypothetical protein